MKKIFAVIVCALFVAGCVFAASKLSPSKQDTQTPVSNPQTASFSNEEFGYSFSYPSGEDGYIVITPPDGPFGDVVFTQSVFSKKEYGLYQLSSTSQETPPSLTITVFRNPKQLSLDLWIQDSSYSNFKLSTDKSLRDISMGSTTYRTYQWDGLYRGDEYIYAQDGYIYVLSNTWTDAHSQVKADMEKLVTSIKWMTPTKLEQTADGDIVLDSPLQGGGISSPVTLTGKARGSWYFEASFPVSIVDASGTVIAQGPAHAQGDWMTQNMVPFEATLSFTVPPNNPHGLIVLKKDNPSGLPEHEDSIEVPILFK